MVERRTPVPISKAAATTCNAVSVAVFVSAGLQPLVAGRFNLSGVIPAVAVVVALQVVLQYILRQVED